jgi:hypothetical protein
MEHKKYERSEENRTAAVLKKIGLPEYPADIRR